MILVGGGRVPITLTALGVRIRVVAETQLASAVPLGFSPELAARTPVLVTDRGETALAPGSCAGFPAGGTAHHLVNRGPGVAVYLEIGDRSAGDAVEYPDDDLAISFADGRARVTRKDGTSY